FPRNAREVGSISSAYSPTSFASATSSSRSCSASRRRPEIASASASQNEQQTNAPSPRINPSSPVYRQRRAPEASSRQTASIVAPMRGASGRSSPHGHASGQAVDAAGELSKRRQPAIGQGHH